MHDESTSSHSESALTVEKLRHVMQMFKDAEIPPPTYYRSMGVVEQFRFPRTKKRRIRRKWSGRIENIRPMEVALCLTESNQFFVHPHSQIYSKLVRMGVNFR